MDVKARPIRQIVKEHVKLAEQIAEVQDRQRAVEALQPVVDRTAKVFEEVAGVSGPMARLFAAMGLRMMVQGAGEITVTPPAGPKVKVTEQVADDLGSAAVNEMVMSYMMKRAAEAAGLQAERPKRSRRKRRKH